MKPPYPIDKYAAVFGKEDDFVLVPLPADVRPNPPLEYAAKNGLRCAE